MGRKNKKSFELVTFYTEYFFAWLGKNFLLFLPWCFARRVGIFLGLVAKIFLRKRRKVVLTNLSLSFPEKNIKQIKQIAHEVWVNLGLTVAEFAKIKKLNLNNLTEYIVINGEEHIKESLKKGRGVILLAGHLGNWEMIGPALALKGYPLLCVVRPIKNCLVDRLVNSIRETTGAKIFYSDEGLNGILSWLKSNRLVGILIDQRVTEGNISVDFFGRPAATSPIIALLARRTGAAVVPICSFHDSQGKLIGQIEPALELKKNKNIRKEILLNTAYFTKIIESWIRKYPGQWFWLHTRWERKL